MSAITLPSRSTRTGIPTRPTAIPITARGLGTGTTGATVPERSGIVIAFERMNRILEWNPETGIIKVEPGVTIERLWRYTMEDGWWSPVMPGTCGSAVALLPCFFLPDPIYPWALAAGAGRTPARGSAPSSAVVEGLTFTQEGAGLRNRRR